MEGSDNIIRVSAKNKPGTYVYEGKEKLKSHGTVSFHAMGSSITNAIRAAERLVSLGYGTMEKFETQKITSSTSEGEDKNVCKVVLELKKTADFEKISEEFEKQKQTSK
mmetsp:Transcript_9905/g.9823  ORF Transcript_9905/g.9823 Transcript_9905/m.9823 type:complete len:109 (+) Transcript_9905:14-340(+)